MIRPIILNLRDRLNLRNQCVYRNFNVYQSSKRP